MPDIVRQPEQHALQFDLGWKIGRAIDEKQSLDELWIVGVEASGDGAYQFDLETYPYWYPLEERLKAALVPDGRALTFEQLELRGFRNQDIETLRRYVEENNPELQAVAAMEIVEEHFANRAKQRAAEGKSLDESDKLSLQYQRSRATSEAVWRWAEGLLESLDNQRQRIIESYFIQERKYYMAKFPSSGGRSVNELQDHFTSQEYLADQRQRRLNANQWHVRSENTR